MTKVDRREALADLGIIALLATADADALTQTQRTWMERYLFWLHERYAADVEVELSLDDETYMIGASGEAGTRYVLSFPRHGSPFVWQRRGRRYIRRSIRSREFFHLSAIERN